jgi:hypothetical protein
VYDAQFSSLSDVALNAEPLYELKNKYYQAWVLIAIDYPFFDQSIWLTADVPILNYLVFFELNLSLETGTISPIYDWACVP